MPELAYQLVDVFTDVPFGGNQLAVFTDPGDLPSEMMQRIARELNLAETTFVLPPADPRNHFRVRIFTPARELPFAGHPTIGTSFVLHRCGLASAGVPLRLEEGVGVIDVTLAAQADGRLMVTMRQPTPQFGAVFEDRAALSAILSLSPGDLIDGLPAQVVSSGLPFLFIPLNTLDAVRRVRVNPDLWLRQNVDANGLFVFTPQTELPGSTVHSRMFAPELGITEDPATGSAHGPLGAYLLRYGVVDANVGRSVDGNTGRHLVGEQGFEIQRPSLLHIFIEAPEGAPEQVTSVSVGGYTQPIGSGVLSIPD